MPGIKEKYKEEVVPSLMKLHSYKNVMQVPRLQKIVLNIGLGEAITNAKAIEAAEKDLTAITGQHPIITRSKRSIANFKLRVGMPIGMKVTLRGQRMWDFLEKLIGAVLPRSPEFQGVSPNSFDGWGNYTLGLKEQTMFPEIEYDKVDKVRGMEISIITTARTDEEGRHLLELLGMPFTKEQ
ncbi:MAG: 50S ribosomal protein L5 [Dehalococcoidales bacterium]|nr:50S ribosomal protein L5 [Dehalococcoidales bacterium]